jgi:hypothetical protein
MSGFYLKYSRKDWRVSFYKGTKMKTMSSKRKWYSENVL